MESCIKPPISWHLQSTFGADIAKNCLWQIEELTSAPAWQPVAAPQQAARGDLTPTLKQGRPRTAQPGPASSAPQGMTAAQPPSLKCQQLWGCRNWWQRDCCMQPQKGPVCSLFLPAETQPAGSPALPFLETSVLQRLLEPSLEMALFWLVLRCFAASCPVIQDITGLEIFNRGIHLRSAL